MIREQARRRWGGLLATIVLAAAPAGAQDPLRLSRSPAVARLAEAERALLDSKEERQEIGCHVDVAKPFLGFDLSYHAVFQTRIRLKTLAAAGSRLRILMRVTPVQHPENQAFRIQRFAVPPIDSEARGEASLPGSFLVGPGNYRVDWVLRDAQGRACSTHWSLDVKNREKNLTPSVAPDTVAQRPEAPFEEPRGPRRDAPGGPLRVKVLANFSPSERRRASTLQARDLEPLVAILRQIAREPQFGSFSLVAFNMNEQRVIYRQDYSERLDLPALGAAVSAVRVGTVDFRQLQDPLSGSHFLTGLLGEELGPQSPEPDAIVIVGPKVMLGKGLPQDELKRAGRTQSPVFYLNYDLNPRRTPWRDAIGSVLKLYQGLEYGIWQPRDVSAALADLRGRLSQAARTEARN